MLYIFEMANNHQGSVEHAKLIIDKFSDLAKKYNISAGVKLQFRQLDSFIHKDYINSDLKYVKRFKDTKLTKKQFSEITQYIKSKDLVTIATPFDNESLSWLEDLDISVIKVASCSIDDLPLLRDICKINKRIILSTGGTDIEHLKIVYDLFKKNKRDFAFMHCVGEYPTPIENSNLKRIGMLKEAFPDIEIGFSTHESPNEKSMSPYAAALGCTIIEKHVGCETDTISLNAYSCNPEQMEKVIQEVNLFEKAYLGKSKTEKAALKNLKRGIYVRRDVQAGETLKQEDVYFSMPLVENQLDASYIDSVLDGYACNIPLKADAPVLKDSFECLKEKGFIDTIKQKVFSILQESKVFIGDKDTAEISAHYGLEQYSDTGVFILNKINREYCKKILVVLPGQAHPTHHHIKKEEAFELLSGDCTLTLNGKDIELKLGSPILISRGVKHSFKSKNGCVIEEISTTHFPNDSVYSDPEINKLELSDRKFIVKKL